jgi:cell division protein FtsA
MKLLDRVNDLIRSDSPLANYFIALDIGTEFIKVLICEIVDDRAVVIGSGRQRQRLGDMQAGAVTDIAGVIENCEVALERAAQQAGVMPEQVVMGIAGELVKGATTTVHYERAKPNAKIDLTELKNIVHKVQWKAFDQVRQQLAWETGHSEIDVKLVNAAIVDVRIDGYRVTNPVGFQGKDVTIGIFNAFAPLVHLTALQAIPEELGLDLLSIAAEPYAVARSMGIEDQTEFSAVFIDIGGGTTDVAVVSNGGVVGTKMFAIGGRTFTKRLSTALNVPFAEAEEAKLGYTAGDLDRDSAKRVKEAMQSDAEVWLSGVQLTLSEFGNIDLLPARILLCGGGSELPEIERVLNGAKWYKSLPFAKQPTVDFIKPGQIPNVKDSTGALTTPQDVTPMGLANLALDLAGTEELLPSILRRAVKAMAT